MSIRDFVTAALLLCLTGAAISKEARLEYLVQGMPKDYKIGFQTRVGTTDLIEMVPTEETVEGWSRMITTQIIRDGRPSSSEFQQEISQCFSGGCDSAESIEVRTGQEGGYPFTLWLHVCHHNPASGNPEYTWIKTFDGRDAFYNVQFAFRHAPSELEVTQAMHYLADVRLTESIPKELSPSAR